MKIKTAVAGVVVLCTVMPASYATNLREVIEQAVLTNPALLESYNNKILREYEVKMAEGGFYPNLEFDASAGVRREDTDYKIGNDTDHRYKSTNAELVLRQMLFDGYMTRNEVKRLERRVASSFFQVYNQAEEVVIQAIQAYSNVLLYQRYVEFAEKNLMAHQKMYDQIEMRSMLGADDQSALSQMKGRLQLAYSNVEAETNNLRDRWTEFQKVAGYRPNDTLEELTFNYTLPESFDEVLDYALSNHPAIASSKEDIVQAKYEKQWAKAFYYPRVELKLSAGYSKKFDYNDDTSDETVQDQAAILGFNWNLYNGGTDKAQIGKWQYDIHAKEEHLELQRRRVEEDTSYAWYAHKYSSKRLEHLERYVAATEETSKAYLQQFQIGERTLLDLLNTENEVFEAQKEWLAVKYENILSKYRILASMGVLLEKINIHLVTDEYYRSNDLDNIVVNDLQQKNQEHRERELDKRNTSEPYEDMHFFKMNNNLRPVSQERRESK